MPDNLEAKWLEYYKKEGLDWLDSGTQNVIRQAFFAGAEAAVLPVEGYNRVSDPNMAGSDEHMTYKKPEYKNPVDP